MPLLGAVFPQQASENENSTEIVLEGSSGGLFGLCYLLGLRCLEPTTWIVELIG